MSGSHLIEKKILNLTLDWKASLLDCASWKTLHITKEQTSADVAHTTKIACDLLISFSHEADNEMGQFK